METLQTIQINNDIQLRIRDDGTALLCLEYHNAETFTTATRVETLITAPQLETFAYTLNNTIGDTR